MLKEEADYKILRRKDSSNKFLNRERHFRKLPLVPFLLISLGVIGLLFYLSLFFNALTHSLLHQPETGEAWILFLIYGSVLLLFNLLFLLSGIFLLKGSNIAWWIALITFLAIIALTVYLGLLLVSLIFFVLFLFLLSDRTSKTFIKHSKHHH